MISRLRLKGFRRYVDETFDLAAGVTFIDGRNNAGKTTLFLAIEYALTGTVANARTHGVLLNPEGKGLGVEIIFTGKDGKTYKLQRLHQLPPRSRTKLVGAFTLKEIVGPDDERYLLSSDFQDHEDALAKKLAEITGITKRVLDLAVHIRQGEIATILEGDPKLDIVLGITAAGTANEEMRTLALADENAAEALPALEASLEHLDKERGVAAADETALLAKAGKLVEESNKLQAGVAAEDEKDDAKDAVLSKFVSAVQAWRSARDDQARATKALAAAGDAEQFEAERAELQLQVDELASKKDETELSIDLRARIRRRSASLADPSCEHCGSKIDRAAAKKELVAWQAELAKLEAASVDEPALQRALQEATQRVRDVEAAAANVERATRGLGIAEASARRLAKNDGRALDAIEADRRAAREQEKIARASERARHEARIEGLTASIDEIEARVESHNKRGADLEREHARVTAAVERLQQRRRRGEDFRRLASTFKQLQEELRTRAATELAARMYEIHKALGVDHEIVEITIDPSRYQVLVTPKSTGRPMPASLAQGGGHRLLLGLAFRLALVERLGPFSFLLLDEPTYGLDTRHRHALLERISSLGLCEQILLITHQDMGNAPGKRIVIGAA